MNTYESSIVCDNCRQQLVTGASHPQPNGALRLAEMRAIKEGWVYRNSKWFCPDCTTKLCPSCQAEIVEKSKTKFTK